MLQERKRGEVEGEIPRPCPGRARPGSCASHPHTTHLTASTTPTTTSCTLTAGTLSHRSACTVTRDLLLNSQHPCNNIYENTACRFLDVRCDSWVGLILRMMHRRIPSRSFNIITSEGDDRPVATTEEPHVLCSSAPGKTSISEDFGNHLLPRRLQLCIEVGSLSSGLIEQSPTTFDDCIRHLTSL